MVEVNDRDARLLINSGKAEPAPAAPVVVEPVLVVQDPEPIQRKTRTRRAKNHGPA